MARRIASASKYPDRRREGEREDKGRGVERETERRNVEGQTGEGSGEKRTMCPRMCHCVVMKRYENQRITEREQGSTFTFNIECLECKD
jgi:hypothetical protein